MHVLTQHDSCCVGLFVLIFVRHVCSTRLCEVSHQHGCLLGGFGISVEQLPGCEHTLVHSCWHLNSDQAVSVVMFVFDSIMVFFSVLCCEHVTSRLQQRGASTRTTTADM